MRHTSEPAHQYQYTCHSHHKKKHSISNCLKLMAAMQDTVVDLQVDTLQKGKTRDKESHVFNVHVHVHVCYYTLSSKR